MVAKGIGLVASGVAASSPGLPVLHPHLEGVALPLTSSSASLAVWGGPWSSEVCDVAGKPLLQTSVSVLNIQGATQRGQALREPP